MIRRGARLLDSGVWIAYFRQEDPLVARVGRWLSRQSVALSSVVVLELLAGGARRTDRAQLRAMAQRFRVADAFVHPTSEDFVLCGEILGDYATQHGAVSSQSHSHDLLIAISAARYNLDVVTTNVSDFARWVPRANRRLKSHTRVIDAREL
jgi:predicted nucleic acid-binding protein